jgi:hypothetical protein
VARRGQIPLIVSGLASLELGVGDSQNASAPEPHKRLREKNTLPIPHEGVCTTALQSWPFRDGLGETAYRKSRHMLVGSQCKLVNSYGLSFLEFTFALMNPQC